MNKARAQVVFSLLLLLTCGAIVGYAAIPQNTIRQNQGAVFPTLNATAGYFVGPNMIVSAARAAAFVTVDTGQGANELYDMDQNVKTTDDVQFNSIDIKNLFRNTVNITDILAYPFSGFSYQIGIMPGSSPPVYYAKNGTTGQIEFSGADAGALVNNVLKSGETYFICPGYFIQTTAIRLLDDIIIYGSGKGVTVFTTDNMALYRLWENDDEVAGNHNIHIYNLSINGNQTSGGADQEGGALSFSLVSDSSLNNIEVYNGYRHNIEFSRCTNIIVDGYEVYNARGDDGVSLDDVDGWGGIPLASVSSRILFENGYIHDNIANTFSSGFEVDKGIINVTISKTLFENNNVNRDIYIGGVPAVGCVLIKDSTFNSSMTHNEGCNETIYDNVVANKISQMFPGGKLTIKNSEVVYVNSEGTVEDKIINNKRLARVLLLTKCSIIGNTFYSIASDAPYLGASTSYLGIFATTMNVEGVIISDNIFKGGTIQYYYIRLRPDATFTMSMVNIHDNIFVDKPSSHAVIMAGGAGTLSTLAIKNNQYDKSNGVFYSVTSNGVVSLLSNSKTFQFTEPIVGSITTTSPTGIDVDAATEGALVWGQLPADVIQVVRIKIWAVSTGTPINAGGQMHLAVTFNAGAANAAYNTATKSWTLTNWDGADTDYSANDVISWIIKRADVGNELDNLIAGDSFEFFALYNAGADPDGATDAVFRCIEVEYV